MAWIYDEECVFYRVGKKCAARKWTCFACEFRIKKMDNLNLDIKDYLNLVFARKTLKFSFLFSMLALLISITALLFEVCKYLFF